MTDIERSGFSEFDRWLGLARRTRELLDALIGEGVLPAGGAAYLRTGPCPTSRASRPGSSAGCAATRPGRDSATCWHGSAPMRVDGPANNAERRAAAAETAVELTLADLDGAAADGSRSASPSRGTWPRLPTPVSSSRCCPTIPDDDVRYPAGRRTYADIAAPRGPAELSDRIEELERSLWRTAAGRRPDPRDPAFRRVVRLFRRGRPARPIRAFGAAA